ncbi:MAG: hypothetical protein NZV14_14670 [Bryobacteraceae bacterium]|nr:hypothetical protein [Bryobacteraceae bacterium]MDW8379406.1 hypothetical protein [Bryobacterales bacterium]
MMTRRLASVAMAGVLAFVVAALPASAKPNFTGVWKLVADKSDFGPLPVPEKLEQKIEHNDPEVKVVATQSTQSGEMTAELNYNTEGKETTNQFRGQPMKCVAKWDGDALTVDSKIDFQGNEITLNDRWTLSEDGQTLILNRKINSPQGEMEMKIVLAKQ